MQQPVPGVPYLFRTSKENHVPSAHGYCLNVRRAQMVLHYKEQGLVVARLVMFDSTFPLRTPRRECTPHIPVTQHQGCATSTYRPLRETACKATPPLTKAPGSTAALRARHLEHMSNDLEGITTELQFRLRRGVKQANANT